jgi:Lipocalin-like domain
MKTAMKMVSVVAAGALACLSASGGQAQPPRNALASLVGTWTLAAADVVHPDGRREPDYGSAPIGLFMVDAQGHYSLQIFRNDRPRFASGDKAKGTSDEYSATVKGTSTHFGTVSVDPAAHVLTFRIEAASYPNEDGTVQKRAYTLTGDVLSYKVAPRPNGDVPISTWRRVR